MEEPTQEEFNYLASALLDFSSASENEQSPVASGDHEFDPYRLPTSPEKPFSDGDSLKHKAKMRLISSPLKTVAKRKAAVKPSRFSQKRVPKKSFVDIQEEKKKNISHSSTKAVHTSTASREITEKAGDQTSLIPSTSMPMSMKKERPVAVSKAKLDQRQEKAKLIREKKEKNCHRAQKALILISSDPISRDSGSGYADDNFSSTEANAKSEPKSLESEKKKKRPVSLSTSKRMRGGLEGNMCLHNDRSPTKEGKFGKSSDTYTKPPMEGGYQSQITTRRHVSGKMHSSLGPNALKNSRMGSLINKDPFVAPPENNSTEKAVFTVKLLHDSSIASSSWMPLHQMPTPVQSLSAREVAGTRGKGSGPGQVGVEMMQALSHTQSIQKKCHKPPTKEGNSMQTQTVESSWFNEADPYKETSHTMDYVCRTVLRFLKSKEEAIADISQEYLQKGMAVVERVKTLHEVERVVVACRFSEGRTACIEACEAAQQTIEAIATKLMRFPVAPAVSEAMEEDLISRLAILQAEVA